MTTYYGGNVTKYNNGGSGDNYISDGYIKSVEKIWMDTVTIGTTAITTADTVVIAKIGPGRKITDVIVTYPALTTENGATGSTLAVGVTGDLDKFIDDVDISVPTVLSKYVDYTLTARMNAGTGYVTTGSTTTDIILSIGRRAATTTGSTITTIVKYT